MVLRSEKLKIIFLVLTKFLISSPSNTTDPNEKDTAQNDSNRVNVDLDYILTLSSLTPLIKSFSPELCTINFAILKLIPVIDIGIFSGL